MFSPLNDQYKVVPSATFLVDVEKINVKELLNLWPVDFKESVYVWMNNNSKGEIFNVLLSLNILKKDDVFLFENFKGKFDFNNTKIRYMESMPVIENIHGFAKIKNDEIILNHPSFFEVGNLIIRNSNHLITQNREKI